MWLVLLFVVLLGHLGAAFNSPSRLGSPTVSSPNSNHNSIYHSSAYHHLNKDKESIYFSSAHKNNKTNHHPVNQPSYSLNGQLLNQASGHQAGQSATDQIKETEQRLYLGQAHIQFSFFYLLID